MGFLAGLKVALKVAPVVIEIAPKIVDGVKKIVDLIDNDKDETNSQNRAGSNKRTYLDVADSRGRQGIVPGDN